MTSPTASRPAGFTLVEMMIAIGIIVVLTALTVSASVALGRKSEERQTRSVLETLDLALSEFELETGRKLTWGVEDQPFAGAKYDMTDGTPHVFTLTEVLARIGRSERVKPILAQLPPNVVTTYDSSNPVVPEWLPVVPDPSDPDANAAAARGQFLSGMWDDGLAVVDAWGTPIRAVHPGRLAQTAFGDVLANADDDGTIFLGAGTYGVELLYGLAQNRRMRFVSAGPDRNFGNIGDASDLPEHLAVEDNVYSYEVVDVH